MQYLAALLLAMAPFPAMAAASAGESAAMILRTVGAAVQLAGFLTVATALWRIALPSAEAERRVSKMIALLLIGVVMVGGPESAGMGMFSRTSADVPDTARPAEATASSPIGTSVDPTAPTILDDAGFWGSLNRPVGGVAAEGIARISLLQIILSLLATLAAVILVAALRSREDDGETADPAVGRRVEAGRAGAGRTGNARAGDALAGDARTGASGGGSLQSGVVQGDASLLALIPKLRDWLVRWYGLVRDAALEARRRIEIFARRFGIVTRTEGGTAAVSMVMSEVRAGGGDVLARIEGYFDRASEKGLSNGGASAKAVVNASWILRSQGIPAGRTAVADLAVRIAAILGERADPEQVAVRLAAVLDVEELGAPEIWVERVGDRYYVAAPGDVAAGMANLRRVDAARVDWIESATSWCLRPSGRREIRPLVARPTPEPEGTTPSTSLRIRSMVRDLKGKIAQ